MESAEVTSVWGQWIDFETDAQELSEFRRLVQRSRRLLRAASIVLLLSFFVLTFYTCRNEPALGLGCLVAVVFAVLVQRRAATSARRLVTRRPAEVRATDTGIEQRSRVHTEWYSWDRVLNVFEGERIVAIEVIPGAGWLIAKRHFPSTAAVDDFISRARNLANSTAPLEPVQPEPVITDPLSPPAPPA